MAVQVSWDVAVTVQCSGRTFNVLVVGRQASLICYCTGGATCCWPANTVRSGTGFAKIS